MRKIRLLNAKDKLGFSLVELMIVISIVSIITGLAAPKFKTFQARARQMEAKNMLNHIYTLQQAFHAENDQYSSLSTNAAAKIGYNQDHGGPDETKCNTQNDLGFSFTDCKMVRYRYTWRGGTSTFGAYADIADSFSMTVNTIFPGCAVEDTWNIDQDKKLMNYGESNGTEYDAENLAIEICY